MLYNISRRNKLTNEMSFLPHNSFGSKYTKWISVNSETCRRIMLNHQVDFILNNIEKDDSFYYFKTLNSITQRTCKICFYGDNTGTNGDLDYDIHKGFTIGKGKQLYCELIWSKNGNVRVYPLSGKSPRWIKGDTEITIHFK